MLRNHQLDEFPWFHLFLEELPEIHYRSKIWESFLEWSCLSDREGLKVVSYGTFPFVNVKASIFDSAHDYGHFKPSRPNDIWIRRDSVQTYEKTKDVTKEWQTARYLEMLILHELVHFGRHHSGAGDDFEYGGLDSGDMFEKQAYINPNLPHIE